MNTTATKAGIRMFRQFCLSTLAAGAALGMATSVYGQSAARLLPAVPTPSTQSGPVVRAAAPEYGVGTNAVPVQSNQPRFQPNTRQPENPGMISGVRDAMFGKPGVPGGPADGQGGFQPAGRTFAGTQAKQAEPMPGAYQTSLPPSSREFAPVGRSFAGASQAQYVQSQNIPQYQQFLPSAPTNQAAQPVTAPGVYAGPPAYRWYGWGTSTPNANPYVQNGQYPRGSKNWHAQTGATPGAFPIPVTVPGAGSSSQFADEPSYARAPAPQPMPAFARPPEVAVAPVPTLMPAHRVQHQEQPAEVVPPAPLPTPEVAPVPLPVIVPQAHVEPKVEKTVELSKTDLPIVVTAQATQPADPTAIALNPVPPVHPEVPGLPGAPAPLPISLQMPSGQPMPIASTPVMPQFHAALPLPVEPQAATGFTNPQPIAVGQGTPSSVKTADLSWQSANIPSSLAVVQAGASEPAKPVAKAAEPEALPKWNSSTGPTVRGQSPNNIEAAIQSVCEGRVTSLKVNQPDGGSVTVVFTSTTETIARAVAADIAKLSEVKNLEVKFEASVLNR